ncbi:hypothetical protein MKX03_025300 [Papaver bracteatum]|nr:hypothetical protein MKX03_025300 [Papaver bracteatum]
MKVAGVKPDLVTVSSVLGANFQSGFVDEATRIFKEIKEKDGVCWTTMIVGYAQNNKEEDAWMLFSEMLAENVKPDKYIISSVVSVCARLASLVHGKVIHSKAIRNGIESDLLVSSALIDMYSKCGETLDARNVFQVMPIRNVVSWNVFERLQLIVGLRSIIRFTSLRLTIELIHKMRKSTEKLDSLMKEIQKAGYVPDPHLAWHDVGKDEKVELSLSVITVKNLLLHMR